MCIRDSVEVGVNGAVILGLCAGVIAGLCTGLLALCLSGLLVDLLADGVESLLQVILLCLDVVNAAGLQGFLQGGELGLDQMCIRDSAPARQNSGKSSCVFHNLRV